MPTWRRFCFPAGYCYINSAVVAALVVAVKDGAKRVTLFDWDLHHGDGSQKILVRNRGREAVAPASAQGRTPVLLHSCPSQSLILFSMFFPSTSRVSPPRFAQEREEVKAFLKSMGARIQFISIHRYGIYPWTGEAEDAGVGAQTHSGPALCPPPRPRA